MCLVSRPLLSPKPGVSIKMQGSPSPLHLVMRPFTSLVSEELAPETLKKFVLVRVLQVADFPLPVTPRNTIDLKYLGSSTSEL